MQSLFRYERHHQPLATRATFLRRLGRNLVFALAGIVVSLIVGMLGYHGYEGLSWLDAYDHAAMILSGMGPYREPATDAGKLFAGSYALYSGLFVVGTSTLILAPVFHRVLHSFHVEDDEDEHEAEKGRKKGKG